VLGGPRVAPVLDVTDVCWEGVRRVARVDGGDHARPSLWRNLDWPLTLGEG